MTLNVTVGGEGSINTTAGSTLLDATILDTGDTESCRELLIKIMRVSLVLYLQCLLILLTLYT